MKWNRQELDDLVLSWADFHALHPERSHDAWRFKRKRLAIAQGQAIAKTHGQPATRGLSVVDNTPAVSNEELFASLVARQKVLQKRYPHTIYQERAIATSRAVCIAFPADLHIGNLWTDHERIKADLELIASHPDVYCALGGDVTDNFLWAEAARGDVAWVEEQRDLFIYLVELVKDSLLWVSSGNHDDWTQKVSGINYIRSALPHVPTLFTGEGGYVRLRVGNIDYLIYRKHRPARYNSSFNLTHNLKQMLRTVLPYEFDIGITEHLHVEDMEQYLYRGRKRVLLCTGTYKLTDPWAESWGFMGGGYGVPAVVLYPDRHLMLPFWSIREALELLDGPTYVDAKAS